MFMFTHIFNKYKDAEISANVLLINQVKIMSKVVF